MQPAYFDAAPKVISGAASILMLYYGYYRCDARHMPM